MVVPLASPRLSPGPVSLPASFDREQWNAHPWAPTPVPEARHRYICAHCGQQVDRRRLGDVLYHEQGGHEPVVEASGAGSLLERATRRGSAFLVAFWMEVLILFVRLHIEGAAEDYCPPEELADIGF